MLEGLYIKKIVYRHETIEHVIGTDRNYCVTEIQALALVTNPSIQNISNM